MLAGVALLAGLVVLVLGVRVRSLVGGTAIDDRLNELIVPRGPNGAFVDRTPYRRVAAVGSRTALIWYVIGVTAFEVGHRRVRTAVVAGLGPLLAVALAEVVLKPAVGRTTALSGALSFPSGTATAGAAMCTGAYLLLYRAGRGWAKLGLVCAVGVVGALDVAVVALSWHYASDVLGGTALGLGTVTLIAVIGSADRRHKSGCSRASAP